MIGAVENKMEQGERARSFRGEVKNALLIAIFTEKLAPKQNLEGRESWECGYRKRSLPSRVNIQCESPKDGIVSMNIKKTRTSGAESEGKGRRDRRGVIVGGRKAQIT